MLLLAVFFTLFFTKRKEERREKRGGRPAKGQCTDVAGERWAGNKIKSRAAIYRRGKQTAVFGEKGGLSGLYIKQVFKLWIKRSHTHSGPCQEAPAEFKQNV